MKREYVLDANAVLTYLLDREGAARMQQVFEDIARGSAGAAISVVNWGEAYYVIARRNGEERTRGVLQPLRNVIALHSPTAQDAVTAASLKLRYKVGYADAFAAALALDREGTLVTSDPEFEK